MCSDGDVTCGTPIFGVDDEGQKDPLHPCQEFADIVAAAAQDREERIAGGAAQRASGFHVADLGLDGEASSQRRREARRQTASLIYTRVIRHLMAAIAAVDHGQSAVTPFRHPAETFVLG